MSHVQRAVEFVGDRVLEKVLSVFKNFSLEKSVDMTMAAQTPRTRRLINRHFTPEVDAYRTISRGVDKDFAELARERAGRYTTIDSLISVDVIEGNVSTHLRFEDPDRQALFDRDMQTRLEDASLVTEVAAYDAFRNLDVKLNTPGRRYFAKSRIHRQAIDSYTEVIGAVAQEREAWRERWKIIAGTRDQDGKRPVPMKNLLEKNELQDRYIGLVNSIPKRRAFEGYLAQDNVRTIANSLYPTRIPQTAAEQLHLDMAYSWSPHNHLLWRFAGATTSLLSYGWNRSVEQLSKFQPKEILDVNTYFAPRDMRQPIMIRE